MGPCAGLRVRHCQSLSPTQLCSISRAFHFRLVMCTESLTWKVMYRNRYNIVAIEWKTIDSRIDEYLYRFENARAQLASGARVKWECSASEARVVRDSVRTLSWELEIRDKVRQFTTMMSLRRLSSELSKSPHIWTYWCQSIGHWGGRSVGHDVVDQYLSRMSDWLHKRNLDWVVFCLFPGKRGATVS